MSGVSRIREVVAFLRANDCDYSAAIVETEFCWKTPKGQSQRRTDVLHLHSAGLSPLEIGQRLRISPATASRIIQRNAQGWSR